MTTDQKNILLCERLGKKWHRPTEQELASGSYYQYEPDYFTDRNTLPELLGLVKDSIAYQEIFCDKLAELIRVHYKWRDDTWPNLYETIDCPYSFYAEAAGQALGLWEGEK